MPYRIKGMLKTPDGSAAAGVNIEFISRRNYSSQLIDLSSVIRTGDDGSYDVTIEFGEYAVVLYWGCAQPSHIGKFIVSADTTVGLDLQTLLQQAGWQPATPEYVKQIQDWLAEAAILTAQANQSALSAKASELEVEEDRAEVAANTITVTAKAAEVSTKHADVIVKAAQVATNTATVTEKTTLAINAADTATQKAAEAAEDSAIASNAATRAENAAQAMTGAILDGGGCDLSGGVYPEPMKVNNTPYSTVWDVRVAGTVDDVSFEVGDVLRYTAVNATYYKIDAVDTATAQINAHASKANAHPISGVAGLADALAEKANAITVANRFTEHESSVDVHDIAAVSGLQSELDSKYSNDNKPTATDVNAVAVDNYTGSALIPSGTTSERTVSPVGGELRFNTDTSDFEGYNGEAWGPLGGSSVTSLIGSEHQFPPMMEPPSDFHVPKNGTLLKRSSYPELYHWASSKSLVVSEAKWQELKSASHGGAVAVYSDGDGSTTFRVPSIGLYGLIQRPIRFGAVVGEDKFIGYADQNKAHTHTRGTMEIEGSFEFSPAANIVYSQSTLTGALYPISGTQKTNRMAGATGTGGATLGFKASRNWTGETSSDGGDEVLMKHMWCSIWIYSGVMLN